jgi:putative FmdB family regulatory protein
MPIYEYVCGKCGKKTEVIQRVAEAPLKVCPHCGGRLKKAFSAPAIQFKGSGWYVTDYARAKQESAKTDKSESEKAPEKAEKIEKGEKSEEKSEKPAKSEKPERKKKDGV